MASVDTGGTLTDGIVLDPQGRLHISKALTMPDRISEGMAGAHAGVAATSTCPSPDRSARAIEDDTLAVAVGPSDARHGIGQSMRGFSASGNPLLTKHRHRPAAQTYVMNFEAQFGLRRPFLALAIFG